MRHMLKVCMRCRTDVIASAVWQAVDGRQAQIFCQAGTSFDSQALIWRSAKPRPALLMHRRWVAVDVQQLTSGS